MKSKISLCLFIIIVSLFLFDIMVLADGKWQIVRDDDFLRKDGVEGDLKDIFFVGEKNGWAVGGGLVLHTSDGGTTWEIQNTGTERPPTLSCTYFRDAKCGIVAGTGVGRGRRRANSGGRTRPGPGGEARPERGGRTRPSPGGGTRPGPGTAGPPPGFGRGGGTAVFKTEDGGKTWVQQIVDARSQLSAIQMVDENIGYAVGARDTVIKTTDGGATWKSIMTGKRARTGETRSYLDGLYLVTPEIGWAVGSYAKIMHTTNGGQNWETQKVNIPNNLAATYFASETEGWIVGQEGVILHTVDAGKTWEQQESDTEDTLYRVVFVDKNIGWACGDFGTIVHTTDGGKTWKRENTGTSTNLRGISAFKGHCWAVGEWGLIIRYVPTSK